jgi:hypothetical protein
LPGHAENSPGALAGHAGAAIMSRGDCGPLPVGTATRQSFGFCPDRHRVVQLPARLAHGPVKDLLGDDLIAVPGDRPGSKSRGDVYSEAGFGESFPYDSVMTDVLTSMCVRIDRV